MWLALAFISAVFLGFYDVSKKAAVRDNAVLPVLLLNTVFSTLIFAPALIDSAFGTGWFAGSILDTAIFNPTFTGERVGGPLQAHLLVVAKAAIVLTSWIFGYTGMKHLPITIVGPINATRPVLVLVGAMVIFGERLNLWQWTGVALAVVSLLLLSLAGKKEKVDFTHNKWIWCVAAAVVTGAASGLYDRFLMRQFNPVFVQGWTNFYQMLMMGAAVAVMMWAERRRSGSGVGNGPAVGSENGPAVGATGGRGLRTGLEWRWSILLISVFISIADFAYMTSLSRPDAMISVVSLVRRGSVVISFLCGAALFKEKNLKAKAFDLALILLGMFFIWLGSR